MTAADILTIVGLQVGEEALLYARSGDLQRAQSIIRNAYEEEVLKARQAIVQ